MVGMVGIRSWFVSWFVSWFGSWFVSWFVVRGSWFVVRGSWFDSIRFDSCSVNGDARLPQAVQEIPERFGVQRP
jgi:hypothetical protein